MQQDAAAAAVQRRRRLTVVHELWLCHRASSLRIRDHRVHGHRLSDGQHKHADGGHLQRRSHAKISLWKSENPITRCVLQPDDQVKSYGIYRRQWKWFPRAQN